MKLINIGAKTPNECDANFLISVSNIMFDNKLYRIIETKRVKPKVKKLTKVNFTN